MPRPPVAAAYLSEHLRYACLHLAFEEHRTSYTVWRCNVRAAHDLAVGLTLSRKSCLVSHVVLQQLWTKVKGYELVIGLL